MTFGADDVQAACRDHLFVARGPFGAQLFDARGPVGVVDALILLQRLNRFFYIAAQHDVCAATRHVGRNRDDARTARLSDDFSLPFVLLGIQHLMRHLFLRQQAGQQFRAFDRGGAHQHRLAALVAVLDVGDHCSILFLRGSIHQIVHVLADHRTMGGYHDRFQTVYLVEFVSLGVGRAGHAGKLAVHAEVVLERDRGECLVLGLDLHAFLRFDGLMQAVRPATSRHQAAGEFVDDDHFAVLHDVLLVAQVEIVGAQAGVEEVHQRDVGRFVETASGFEQAFLCKDVFGVLVPRLGQQHGVRLLVDPVVARAVFHFAALELRCDRIEADIQVGVIIGLPGNDQRRSRFVDQDRVDFVDDRVIQAALHPLFERIHHVVAQVVEAEFVIGAVSDVRRVGDMLLVLRHARQVHAGRHAEETVQPTHHFGIAAREVVVYRHHMHALAGQCIQIHGECRSQRLALAGAHFGDPAAVQHDAADQLHVEVPHAQNALARLAHHGKGLGQEVVE